MKASYRDILDRIPDPPTWWDRHGVPRWSEPTPENSSNIYADTVVFLKIACQQCGREYLVERSFSRSGRLDRRLKEFIEIDPVQLTYGDPPNTGCCLVGSTMSSITLEVVAAYRQQAFGKWAKTHENVKVDSDIAPMSDQDRWW